MKKVHSEIIYLNQKNEMVHSDTCPTNCNFKEMTEDHKIFLHECLEEWLTKSNGSGCFYIKDENILIPSGEEDASYE